MKVGAIDVLYSRLFSYENFRRYGTLLALFILIGFNVIFTLILFHGKRSMLI